MKFLAHFFFFTFFLTFFSACRAQKKETIVPEKKPVYFLGADFSYVNEMESCGAAYKLRAQVWDVYDIFKEKGATIARFRLWHTPDWTQYSTFQDVKKGIRRAKEKKMRVLLDFHYSDTWTDPSRQNIPKAWKNILNVQLLGDSLYLYTQKVLMDLHAENLLPDLVQVGNEINAEILQYSEPAVYPINWPRNIALLNRGIQAVNDVAAATGKPIGTMLHIAQPENAFYWFSDARSNGIKNFDWIGLSYYSQWSKMNLEEMGKEISKLKSTFGKRIMVVECGYPFSLTNGDEANNLLDTASQMPGYSINPNEQKRFMVDLTKTVIKSGGEGVIYWEPAWISTPCRTQWGKGSHWDNATFFDQTNRSALPAFDFFNEEIYK
jgi:arabinogalactan endo-1,4-beta-galactosidase